MNIELQVVPRDEFSKIDSLVHKACFGEDRPSDFNRYDYALICRNIDKDILTAYATILEHDSETAYMQHGGALSDDRMATVKSYLMMIKWLKEKYEVITTRILNTNTAMLKMAMQAGFLIHGVESYPKETRNHRCGTLLSLHIERCEDVVP